MNAPRAPMPTATSRFGYPFKDKDDREIVDPYAFIEALIPVQGGHYLLGSYGFFHGGIHLDRACSSKLSIDDGIRCLGCPSVDRPRARPSFRFRRLQGRTCRPRLRRRRHWRRYRAEPTAGGRRQC
ncbi:hypothetical protein L3D22_04025 [Lysobacter soli]|uniref:hypothetical protein n=1 Tax=Lysobacter soli TaxID=453783 RepID=UPI0020A03D2A|nr:hypothetical protein [Lysobacter soli]UTA55019.1 hypothetical protein L3D22_04025 [Lysobacter soli]